MLESEKRQYLYIYVSMCVDLDERLSDDTREYTIYLIDSDYFTKKLQDNLGDYANNLSVRHSINNYIRTKLYNGKISITRSELLMIIFKHKFRYLLERFISANSKIKGIIDDDCLFRLNEQNMQSLAHCFKNLKIKYIDYNIFQCMTNRTSKNYSQETLNLLIENMPGYFLCTNHKLNISSEQINAILRNLYFAHKPSESKWRRIYSMIEYNYAKLKPNFNIYDELKNNPIESLKFTFAHSNVPKIFQSEKIKIFSDCLFKNKKYEKH